MNTMMHAEKNCNLEDRLFFSQQVKDNAADVARQIRCSGRDFIQFGAGITGEKAVKFFNSFGLKPLCFCDNNPAKHNTWIDNIEVFSLSYIREKFRDYYIVITCDAFLEISNQLVSVGVSKKDILYIEPDWLNSPKGQGEYIKEHIQEFKEAYRLMSDNKSRDVFAGLLNYRITHDLSYVEPFTDVVPYFDNLLISLEKEEVFLDCGAFVGDTLIDFVEYSKGLYRRAYCFEPNHQNLELLRKCIKEREYHDVEIFPYGLSNKKQTLRFGGSSENGRILDTGSIFVECDTIDNLLYDREKKVTYIKMDIEGSEYYALNGASKVIKRDHPKLAICVYHKPDDYFVLTKQIKELWDGYHLFFRQYELSGEETVCYAIP